MLEYLYENPIVAVHDIMDLIGTTLPAANNLVIRMVDCDILCEITGQSRNRRFMYQDYIGLFPDEINLEI